MEKAARRKITVLGAPDLEEIEARVHDWLTQGHQLLHLQIDYLPQQPYCQQWQAMITYHPVLGKRQTPRLRCRRCREQATCRRLSDHRARIEQDSND